MSKPKTLVQLDTDAQPSVFDSIVAVDAGVEFLLRHQGVTAGNVRSLVHGVIFTRGPDDLKHTAIFVGGSDVAAGEAVLEEIRQAFFGPLRVSVLFDPSGANTTAAAAVLAAAKHLPLAGATVAVLAATGPVGQRVVRLLAREGATVRAGSRSAERATEVCRWVAARTKAKSGKPPQLSGHATGTPSETRKLLEGAQAVIAAGAAGVELLSHDMRRQCATLRLAVDLNAVPPVGLAGVEPSDRAVERDGAVCYGALGVGAMKMKIHKAAIARLFESNDQILDAEQLVELASSGFNR